MKNFWLNSTDDKYQSAIAINYPRMNPSHPLPSLRRRPLLARLASFSCALCLSACASTIDKGLDLMGLMKKPDTPALPDAGGSTNDLAALGGPVQGLASAAHPIALRVHAGQVLNSDPGGRSLSLVLRIYKLRGISQFAQATYASVAASSADHPIGGDEVIAVDEIVLVPGQKYEVFQSIPRDARYLAVVALFRAPDSQRWRFVFDTKSAARTGVTLGAHGCALSVATGEAVGVPPEALRLAGVQCS